MPITAARETTARPFATPHHPSKSTSALESFVRSNPTHSVEKMWQIASFASKEKLNAYQADRLTRAPKQVRMIKVADRVDNVSDLHLLPNDGKMERYLKDTRENYLNLAKNTDPALYRFLDRRVSQLENLAELSAAA